MTQDMMRFAYYRSESLSVLNRRSIHTPPLSIVARLTDHEADHIPCRTREHPVENLLHARLHVPRLAQMDTTCVDPRAPEETLCPKPSEVRLHPVGRRRIQLAVTCIDDARVPTRVSNQWPALPWESRASRSGQLQARSGWGFIHPADVYCATCTRNIHQSQGDFAYKTGSHLSRRASDHLSPTNPTNPWKPKSLAKCRGRDAMRMYRFWKDEIIYTY